MMRDRRPMDEILTDMRKACTIELAGMLKGAKSGTAKELNRILARFSLQEARTLRKAKEYLGVLKMAGLVTFTNGHKRWKYHPEAEWELFNVQI